MKINREGKPSSTRDPSGAQVPRRAGWKILVIDDEPDMLAVTRLALRDFSFAGRSLEIIEADSAAAARARLDEHPDMAMALIDVVMETDDAGLKLVEHIRKDRKNMLIRLVIRTGQPGAAPERFVIDHYDIDDYKDKTELTATRLYTTIRSALKAYRDLEAINRNRLGLEQILTAMPTLYHIGNDSLANFFSGILTQIIALCQLSHTSHIGTMEGVISTFDGATATIHAFTDHFTDCPRFTEIHDACVQTIQTGILAGGLRQHSQILPLLVNEKPVGYIYIEPFDPLTDDDIALIHIMTRQCSQALENFKLHDNILTAFDNAIDMLAEIAEFKDKTTGDHINRIDRYTRSIALAMGVAPDEAVRYGKASRLHDIGKIGIPEYILGKPGKLTPDEYDIIKLHTTIGASILAHDTAFDMSRDVALHHHERWDGTGYPDGMAAQTLPLVTRIVSVADVFDALINRRPYKTPWEIGDVRQVIADGAGTQFDPQVVQTFLILLDRGEFDEMIQQAARS
jgi:response regulator RpfG family c-di-GMP phosphodiesterase